jgi:hypothetical protein
LKASDLYNLIDWRIPRPNIQQAHTDEAKIWLKVSKAVQKWLESGVSDEIRRMIRNQGIVNNVRCGKSARWVPWPWPCGIAGLSISYRAPRRVITPLAIPTTAAKFTWKSDALGERFVSVGVGIAHLNKWIATGLDQQRIDV